MTALSSVFSRAEKAAQILSISTSDLLKILAEEGISNDDIGFQILSSEAVTVDHLVLILVGKTVNVTKDNIPTSVTIKPLPARAAAAILKGMDGPQSQEKLVYETAPSHPKVTDTLVKVLQTNKTPHQMKDRELLEAWMINRDYEMEQELHRRAKNDRFIVLKEGKYEPGKEVIDVEQSLKLLKNARHRKNPTFIPIGNTVAPVYFITQLSLKNRIVEFCPICGRILYEGYCTDCELNWTGIGADERTYVHLVARSDKFDRKSRADRRSVFISAMKGLADLKITWPSFVQEFYDLKAADLPKLHQIEDRPSREVKDPFHAKDPDS